MSLKRPKQKSKRISIQELEKYTDNDEITFDMPQSGKGLTIKNKYSLSEVHKSFLDLCLYDKTKMALVDGPAGTAKTYLAVLAALTLYKEKKIDQIVYIRSIVESATKSIGALPGEVDEKFKPWALPMLEKLNELLTPSAATNLITDGVIKCIPVNFVRGLTFHNSFVIIDEAQNLTREELVTILTRFGHNSRYVVVGDSLQKDIGKHSGFKDILRCFDDEESMKQNIHTMTFGESEIVRSMILRFIVRKLGA
jgi:phosphate starvation-inducible PhoH-like protein